MKIAIDCRYILDPANGQFGGISEYTDGLVRALIDLNTNNKFVLFFSDKYSGDLAFEQSSVEIVRVSVERGNFFFNHFSFPWLVHSYHPDIFFAPHGQLPFGLRDRAIITIHDLVIYDHPEWFPGGFSRWFSTKIVVPISLRRAKKILAVSKATKHDLTRIFGVFDNKVTVVYPAVSGMEYGQNNVDRRYSVSSSNHYFLCLGTIEPRKNFILAAKAMKIFHEKFPDYKLLVVGKRGWKFQMTIEEFGGADFIEEIGYVSLCEKNSLIAGAKALIFPSLYEGFGLPPLEVMTLGVPVITTQEGSLPEVCGPAARYILIDDPKELATAMEEIIDEKIRRSYIEKGLIQAKKFSWKKTAEEVLKNFYE